MSILSKLANKFLRIPEVKIPFGEVLLLNQIKDTLHYLSATDLDMLAIAIKAERASRGSNL
jgi:hypothetical protein